jgi:hypothetical protein
MSDVLALIAAIAIVYGLVFAWARRRETKTAAEEPSLDLLRKCAGDKDAVERLIEGERKRHPKDSRTELIKRAIERWKRHR